MSVYHCPLCPLIFQFRTEVEWHLREEHRSRSDEAAELRSELASATEPLDWERLAQLRSSNLGPSVTLLLSTTPAPAMTILDIARLRQLAERARRRLSTGSHREPDVRAVEERLATAVSATETQATDRGMAVLVNRHHLAIIPLPFGPRDRQVVERRFNTRDLEYALRRFPRYRVLLLGHHPRILEGRADAMSEPPPVAVKGAPAGVRPAAAGEYPGPDTLLDRRVQAAGPLPLVVVGDERQLEWFRRHSRHGTETAAEVRRPRFHRAGVSELVRDAIGWIGREQQSRAVAELLHADMQSQVAWGVRAAWSAVHDGTADRLWVEHDYTVTGPAAGGAGREPGADPSWTVPAEDPVDALIAKAAEVGIETHLLDSRTLVRPEPVAVKIPVGSRVRSRNPWASGEDTGEARPARDLASSSAGPARS